MQNIILSALGKAAIAYATRGFAVFPCVPRGKVPATRRGCRDATKDLAQITAWWRDNLEGFRSRGSVACMSEVIGAHMRTERGHGAPILRERCGMVRSAAFRRCALSLLNAISIGLRSGEYLGR